MRASHIQSELVEAIDNGASRFESYGPFNGPMTGDDSDLSNFMLVVVRYLIAPRLAEFNSSDYFGETIDPACEVNLITKAGEALPIGVGMTNWKAFKAIPISWSDKSVSVNGHVIPRGAGDKRDLIHWLTWAVAEFFGEEDA